MKKQGIYILTILILVVGAIIFSYCCEEKMEDMVDYEEYKSGKLNLEEGAVEYGNQTNGNFYMFGFGDGGIPRIYDIENDKFYSVKKCRQFYGTTLVTNGIIYEDEKNGNEFYCKYDLQTGQSSEFSSEKDANVFFEDKMICYEDNEDTSDYGKIVEINMNTKKQKEITDEAWLKTNDKSNIYYLQKANKKMYRYNLYDGQKNELYLPNGKKTGLLPSDEDGVLYVVYENKDIGRVAINGVYEKVGNFRKDYKYFQDSLNDKLRGNDLYMFESWNDNDSVLFKKNLKTGKGENILKKEQLKKYIKKLTGNDLKDVDASFCKDYIVLFARVEDERHPQPENYEGDGYDNKYLLIYDYNGKLIRTRTLQEWR